MADSAWNGVVEVGGRWWESECADQHRKWGKAWRNNPPDDDDAVHSFIHLWNVDPEIRELVKRIRSHYAVREGFPPRRDRSFAEKLKRWVVNSHQPFGHACSIQAPLEVLTDGPHNEQSLAVLLAAMLSHAGFISAVMWHQCTGCYCTGVALVPNDDDDVWVHLGIAYVIWANGHGPKDLREWKVCTLSPVAECQQIQALQSRCPNACDVYPWVDICPKCNKRLNSITSHPKQTSSASGSPAAG